MKKIKLVNSIRWIAKISFVILLIIEKLDYFETLKTEQQNFIKYFRIGFLVVFIIASIVENKMIIKRKDKEIESLKKQLNEKT